MGPAFFNMRIICDCLGKAIRRHIDFSEGEYWFLDDKKEAKKEIKHQMQNLDLADSADSGITQFSYQFKEELKIKEKSDKNKEDENDFERSIDQTSFDVVTLARRKPS